MVARYHGRSLSAQSLRAAAQPSRSGISMADLARLSESVGLRTAALRCKFAALAEKLPLPCIAHWDQRHFVVVYAVRDGRVVVADPSCGVQRMSQAEFLRHWSGGEDQVGVVLLLEPTPEFFGAELPGRVDGALALHRPLQVGDGEAERSQPVGVDPDPHRVRRAAEHPHIADAGHPQDLIGEVDRRVVGQEAVVVASPRRVQS
jgi:hypothetical protein